MKSKIKNKTVLVDSKVFAKSSITMIALIIPMNIIHEAGHGLVCYLEGHVFQMNILITQSSLVCSGTIENYFVFYFLGGGLTALVCSIPLLFVNIRKRKWIAIPCLSFVSSQLLNAIIESVFTQWYLENTIEPAILLGMMGFSFYLFFTIIFGRKN